jgi:hypothetical protein
VADNPADSDFASCLEHVDRSALPSTGGLVGRSPILAWCLAGTFVLSGGFVVGWWMGDLFGFVVYFLLFPTLWLVTLKVSRGRRALRSQADRRRFVPSVQASVPAVAYLPNRRGNWREIGDVVLCFGEPGLVLDPVRFRPSAMAWSWSEIDRVQFSDDSDRAWCLIMANDRPAVLLHVWTSGTSLARTMATGHAA